MTSSLLEWAAFDVKAVPTPVLAEILRTIRDEMTIRRREERVQTHEAMVAGHQLLKRHPKPHHEFNRHMLPYLEELLAQDWSHLFQGGDGERKYYVYAHIQPSGKAIDFRGAVPFKLKGWPFYIGKGTGNRAFDLNRNQGHGATLKELQDRGLGPKQIAHVLADGLTEDEAFELESKLIYFFGTKYERGRRGLLVNLDIPAHPF